jgi:hypothetical protein
LRKIEFADEVSRRLETIRSEYGSKNTDRFLKRRLQTDRSIEALVEWIQSRVRETRSIAPARNP